MPLISMARTQKERKLDKAQPVGESPKFPYGLSISLDDESLDKLGIKNLPKVGDFVRLDAVGRIESISQSSHTNSTNRSVSIQIEKLAVKRGRFKSATDAVDAAVKDA